MNRDYDAMIREWVYNTYGPNDLPEILFTIETSASYIHDDMTGYSCPASYLRMATWYDPSNAPAIMPVHDRMNASWQAATIRKSICVALVAYIKIRHR